MQTVSVKLILDKDKALERLNLCSGGLVQQAVDKAVIDYSLQYCPWDTGNLAKSAYGATQIGSGKVVWPGPQAHYLYYGIVYGPNIPIFGDNTGVPSGFFSPPNKTKHPTGASLVYKKDTNPLAGPFWAERMAADHKADIVKEGKAVVGK